MRREVGMGRKEVKKVRKRYGETVGYHFIKVYELLSQFNELIYLLNALN